jgi:hypothetical protein
LGTLSVKLQIAVSEETDNLALIFCAETRDKVPSLELRQMLYKRKVENLGKKKCLGGGGRRRGFQLQRPNGKKGGKRQEKRPEKFEATIFKVSRRTATNKS